MAPRPRYCASERKWTPAESVNPPSPALLRHVHPHTVDQTACSSSPQPHSGHERQPERARYRANLARPAPREEIPAQYLDSAFQAESTLLAPRGERCEELDRKSTRLNSSHLGISYA